MRHRLLLPLAPLLLLQPASVALLGSPALTGGTVSMGADEIPGSEVGFFLPIPCGSSRQ